MPGLSFEPRGGAAPFSSFSQLIGTKPSSLQYLELNSRMQKTAEYLSRAAECGDVARILPLQVGGRSWGIRRGRLSSLPKCVSSN